MQIEGFVKDHPIMCTVIALGVLVTVAPWVIQTLGFCAGFGELGPIEGMSFLFLRASRLYIDRLY